MNRFMRARLMALAVRGCFMDGGEPAGGGDTTKPAEGEAVKSLIGAAAAPAPTAEETAAKAAADQRAFLVANTEDGEKGLEGKTPEQIAALHGALVKKLDADKAASAAKAPTADEQKKYLTDKGVKPEDLAKLDEKGIRAKFDELKAAEGKLLEYKDFVFPEGVKPDEKMLKDFTGIMAKAKVPQEIAQQLIDLYGGQLAELANAPYKLWGDTQKTWQANMKADTEVGGAKMDENLSFMAKAIDHIGGEDAAAIRQVLDLTGAGNHPMIGRFLYRIGKLLGEGEPVDGGGKPAIPNAKNPAMVLYPDQGKSQLGNAG